MPYTNTPSYGFQRAAYNLLQGLLTNQNQLENKNIKILVYSWLGQSLKTQEYTMSKNITIFSYQTLPPKTFLQCPQNFFRLFKQNKEVDIVHSNDVMFTLPAALALRKPLVQTFHGFPWRAKENSSSGYYRVFCDLWNIGNKLAIKNINNIRFVCVSRHVFREMKTYYNIPEERMTVIDNPISDEFFQVNKQEDEGLIFYPARLTPGKNHLVLIRALAILKKMGCFNFRLVLAGDSGDSEYFKTMKTLIEKNGLKNNVTFVGKVQGVDLLHLYAKASLVVVPSLNETFSLPVAEAMATGTAVVASPVGIVLDTIKDGVNGFVIDPSNPKDIAKKIYLLLNDNLLRKKVGEQGKKIAMKWKPERVAKELIDFWLITLDDWGKKIF